MWCLWGSRGGHLQVTWKWWQSSVIKTFLFYLFVWSDWDPCCFFDQIPLNSNSSVTSLFTCYSPVTLTQEWTCLPSDYWYAYHGGFPTPSEDVPQTKYKALFLFNYFSSILGRSETLTRTICLCFAQSKLATSWSHEMKTKCPMWWWNRLQWDGGELLPPAQRLNRCSERLGEKPKIPWNWSGLAGNMWDHMANRTIPEPRRVPTGTGRRLCWETRHMHKLNPLTECVQVCVRACVCKCEIAIAH